MSFIRWFVRLCWIGICAVAMLWQTHLLVGRWPPSVWLVGFVFGATVFGYNFTATPLRRWPAWFLGAGSAACFTQLPLAQQLAALLPACIWLLYRPGLRHFPIIKPVAIALAWAWVTAWLPMPLSQWTTTSALFVGRAAFIFALALGYDMCDQPYDLKKGLPTLVLQIGPRRALRLINGALALGVCSAVLNGLLGIYSWHNVLALAVSLLISGWALHRITPVLAWGDWRKALIDALMVLQLGFVWWSVKFG